jgi:hypothetical protein
MLDAMSGPDILICDTGAGGAFSQAAVATQTNRIRPNMWKRTGS